MKPHRSINQTRDERLDLFRGLALAFMLIDHLPGSYLSRLTLRNYGFSDAAEMFVLIAGISSAMAYARRGDASYRISRRIAVIYVAQCGLLLATAAMLFVAYGLTGDRALLREDPLAPFLADAWLGLHRIAIMNLQPQNVDILPLYVMMLVWLVVFLRAAECSRVFAFVVSFGLWLLSSKWQLNLPGYRDNGWYFNPFAWQFLLSIGVLIGLHRLDNPGESQRRPIVLILALAFLAFSFAYARPWALFPIRGLQSLYLLPPDLLGPLNKSYLSIWRLVHVLCLFYVASVLVPVTASWLRTNRIAVGLIAVGRVPLTSFLVASLASTIGTLLLMQMGNKVVAQLCVNIAALAGVYLLVTYQSRSQAILGCVDHLTQRILRLRTAGVLRLRGRNSAVKDGNQPPSKHATLASLA